MSFTIDVRAEVVLRRADDDASGIARCEGVVLSLLSLLGTRRQSTHFARSYAHTGDST